MADYQRGGRAHQIELRLIQEKDKNGVARDRKEVLLDGVKKKINEVIGHFNAVLFLPHMLAIVEGSPSHRRRYLDLALSQVRPAYAANLKEYGQVLSQRNALLKQLSENGGDAAQLDYWDGRLAKRGAQLIHDRILAVKELDALAGRIHLELTRGGEVLRLNYQPAYDPLPPPENQMNLIEAPIDRSKVSVEKIEDGFLARLGELRREEIARGQTTIGPNRDELRFLSNGIDLGTYGSRGQVRTCMLTMKLAEMEWMQAKTGHWPVLLLDEVLAELDEERRVDLLSRVASSDQVLLTTTDLGLFDPSFVKNTKIWHIKGGRLKDK
ncbi:MAG: DNA replication/repair protein RecF [Chloroflexi bacterium]|nr:DNA replication/repair protein RecF [Chloroflexota bacterium]